MTAIHQHLTEQRLRFAAAGAFAVALAIFLLFEANHIATSGYWTDELFSLWAGDPRVPFSQAFMERILADTNAPIYFSLVHLTRGFVYDGRAAFIIINAIGLALLLGTMIRHGFKRDTPITALLIAAVFLLGAPALAYAPEGRAYILCMATCVALSFIAGGIVTGPDGARNDIVLSCVLAALATWLHVYGAIFAGALGAALIAAGWLSGKRAYVIKLGFSIGLAATAAFILWIAFAYPMFSKTVTQGFWLPFTPASVTETAWMVKQYTIGWTPAALLGAAFLALSLWPAHSRPIALVTMIAGALFLALPVLASFHTVILHGRYVLVGTPALLALTALTLRTHLLAAPAEQGVRWSKSLAALGALFLAAPLLTGVPTAAWHFRERWDWRGMDVIGPLADQCTEKQVRVLNSSIRNLSGFEYLLDGKLTPIDAAKAPVRDVSTIACPVLGWAEHYLASNDDAGWAKRVGAPEALAAFHLTNERNLPLMIERHPGGLVLRKID